jgi:hypothetical protein
MGLKYWTTSGSGGNAIAITKEHFRSGSQSL